MPQRATTASWRHLRKGSGTAPTPRPKTCPWFVGTLPCTDGRDGEDGVARLFGWARQGGVGPSQARMDETELTRRTPTCFVGRDGGQRTSWGGAGALTHGWAQPLEPARTMIWARTDRGGEMPNMELEEGRICRQSKRESVTRSPCGSVPPTPSSRPPKPEKDGEAPPDPILTNSRQESIEKLPRRGCVSFKRLRRRSNSMKSRWEARWWWWRSQRSSGRSVDLIID